MTCKPAKEFVDYLLANDIVIGLHWFERFLLSEPHEHLASAWNFESGSDAFKLLTMRRNY